MQKLKLTIVAQLHERNNRCLIEYMEASRKITVKHCEKLSTQ